MKRKLLFLIGIVVLLAALTSCGKTAVTWLDADGTVLEETEISRGEGVPDRSLPADTELWRYTGWREETDGKTFTVIAERQPQASYFAGNVFRILVKDLSGTVISVGTGFVFDETGRFITNSHVMKGGYEAEAVFAIGDGAGASVTSFDEVRGYSDHADKDIFVGKIEGYAKIADHYKDLSLVAGTAEDTAFSVSYTDAELTVTQGQNGGGVLFDAALNPIGFAVEDGASVSAAELASLTTAPGVWQTLAFFLHPDQEAFISFFRSLANDGEFVPIKDGEDLYYEAVRESSGVGTERYRAKERFLVCEDGWVEVVLEYSWEGGDTRREMFSGTYSSRNRLDDFSYTYLYTWKSGNYMEVYSDNLEYSSDLALTLPEYEVDFRHGQQQSSSSIEYMKKCFNAAYEYLYNILY